MSTTLYDASSDRQFNPFAGVFTLTLGIALLVWYLHGIVEAVEVDIHNFPAAFHESPVLTLIFVVLKPIGYVSFGALFILMIYGPMRNLFLKRVVSGKLRSMSVKATGKGNLLLSVEIGPHHLVLRDRGGLGDVICDEALLGQELKFILGAFNRVLKVEKGP